MNHSYIIRVIRDDGVECGEIEVPAQREHPSFSRIGVAVVESIRRGEDTKKPKGDK